MNKQKEWFGTWFDSPYYHILYKNRDQEEAKTFIDVLADYFHLKKTDHILDLACGKGRHAIYLNQKGFDVVGIDLSEKNIAFAKKFENERLSFYVHDMRKVFREASFDYILNLFTSFGYFETSQEHEDAICAAQKAMKNGGTFLIDFLNPYNVINKLVPEEIKEVDGIEFHIRKKITKEGFITKDITFADKGKVYHFQEKVKAISEDEFMAFFEKANLTLLATFGNYNLEKFQYRHSERMIFILKK